MLSKAKSEQFCTGGKETERMIEKTYLRIKKW